MRYISLYFLGFPIFNLCSISVDSCSGSPEASFVPRLLSDTGVSTPLFSDTDSLLADVDSCDEDDEEVDEVVKRKDSLMFQERQRYIV